MQYPWLDRDESCDVAVVGGGAAGAMCAYEFASAGAGVVLLSAGPAGYGATSRSQGIISPEADGGLTGLAQKIGMDSAVKVYKLCAKAAGSFEELDTALQDRFDFTRRDCFYYTARDGGKPGMDGEFLARKHNGFAVELIDEAAAREMFSFPVKAGILSAGAAAELNPYRLTHALIRAANENGARVYENTAVLETEGNSSSGYTLICETGRSVEAKRVIFATGAQNAKEFPLVTCSRTAFSLVTAPVGDFGGWRERCVICSDDDSGVRMRTTPDGRIIISGLECGAPAGLKGLMGILSLNSLPEKKLGELEDILRGMFPGIAGIMPEYAFSYDYAATHDSLPVIGSERESGISYALCTGENGLAFAKIASEMLLSEYQGHPADGMELFSSER